MPNTLSYDLEAVTKEVLDPIIEKYFEGSREKFNEYRAKLINPHPWLTDARALLRMLEGSLAIPHDEYSYVTNSGCKECLKAMNQRIRYKFHLLSKESGQV